MLYDVVYTRESKVAQLGINARLEKFAKFDKINNREAAAAQIVVRHRRILWGKNEAKETSSSHMLLLLLRYVVRQHYHKTWGCEFEVCPDYIKCNHAQFSRALID